MIKKMILSFIFSLVLMGSFYMAIWVSDMELSCKFLCNGTLSLIHFSLYVAALGALGVLDEFDRIDGFFEHR